MDSYFVTLVTKGKQKKIYVYSRTSRTGESFRYLRSLISEYRCCSKEIRSRVEMAKNAFIEKKVV